MPFSRIVREMANKKAHSPLRFEKAALEVLQRATEDYAVQFFTDLQANADNDGHKVVTSEDLAAVNSFRRNVIEQNVSAYIMREDEPETPNESDGEEQIVDV